MQDPKWLTAMLEEFSSLQHNKTWTLVPLPPHYEPIGCKWVFWVKENAYGTINKYKARLVAKGFDQQWRFNLNETLSPVINPITVCVILTLAFTNKWPLAQQLDVNNAFMNSLLEVQMVIRPKSIEYP